MLLLKLFTMKLIEMKKMQNEEKNILNAIVGKQL